MRKGFDDDPSQRRPGDLMLQTHGHFDHFEDAVGLAREHRPAVVANFEICQYLEPASHTGSIRSGARILPGGEAVGYVLEFENSF